MDFYVSSWVSAEHKQHNTQNREATLFFLSRGRPFVLGASMTADGDLVSLPPQWNKTMVSDRKPRSLLSFPSEPSPPLPSLLPKPAWPPPTPPCSTVRRSLFWVSLGDALRGVVLDLAGSECRGFYTERRVRGKGIGREGGREGGIISHIEQYIILFCFQPPP